MAKLAHGLDTIVTIVDGYPIKPRDASVAIDVPTNFANRTDALVPVAFGLGNAALIQDERITLIKSEAAGGCMLCEGGRRRTGAVGVASAALRVV